MPLKKKNKTKKNISKKVKKTFKKIKNQNISKDQELIIKTKPEWVKASLASKDQYEKNILNRLKIMMNFGKKKEKELLG